MNSSNPVAACSMFSPVRLVVLAALAMGCGSVQPAEQRDAGADAQVDSNAPNDSTGSRTPRLVTTFADAARGSQMQTTVQTPGTGPGRMLVMIITYSVPTSSVIQVDSANDDSGVPLRRALGPIEWTSSGYFWRTEVWAGHRSHASVATTVKLSGEPKDFSYYYASEFEATSIDQAVFKTGMRSTGGPISSGSSVTAYPHELVFGHGEGEGIAKLSAGSGFTVQRNGPAGVLEETMTANAPGTYEAPFSMDSGGHWIALMLTLR